MWPWSFASTGAVYGRFRVDRDGLRFPERFFPGADPRRLEIVRFLARILQDHSGLLGRAHGRLQQMPERPVASVKSGNQKVAQDWRGLPRMRESAAIGFRKNFESCCLQVGAKFSHHRAKTGQVDSFEFGSGGAELFEQAKEMIRSAPDRNSGETIGFGKAFIG